MKRALEVAPESEDEESEDEPRNVRGTAPPHAKGTFRADSHDAPEKVQALGRFLEACGGDAGLVQSWKCQARVKTTCGSEYHTYYDDRGRKFRSQREVAKHFGLDEGITKPKAAAPSTSSALVAVPSSSRPIAEEDAVSMTVVWATMRGFPPWPAEVMQAAAGGRFTVRFFATDDEATLPGGALMRYCKRQKALRQGRGGKVGSTKLREQFFKAIALADEALVESPVDFSAAGHGWHVDGSAWIGRQVRRVSADGVPMDGLVDRWLPAGEGGSAKWHVLYRDGADGELDEREVQQAATAFEAGECRMATDGASKAAVASSTGAVALLQPAARSIPAVAPPAAAMSLQPAAHIIPAAEAAGVGAHLEGLHGMRAVLAEMRLESYVDALEEAGWDDLEFLMSFDGARLAEVARSVGMKPGHAGKFAVWFVPTANRLMVRDEAPTATR